MTTPTAQAYREFQTAYDWFNASLFGGGLPACLITLQRRARAKGYFSGDRFDSARGDITDEIAMNPSLFRVRSVEETLSTLVHEMAHLWQHHFGQQKSRTGYHNREWAAKMEDLGLIPTDTGERGGKKTGQRVTHYILPGGPFAQTCADLLATGLILTWSDRVGPGRSRRRGDGKRTKYRCPCGTQAWAKPDAALICGSCCKSFVPLGYASHDARNLTKVSTGSMTMVPPAAESTALPALAIRSSM